jgi:hypothetical protein
VAVVKTVESSMLWLIHHMNQRDAGRCPMGINVIGHFAKPPDNAGQYFVDNVDYS